MPWNVGTNPDLSREERTTQRQKIVNSGMEYYARFQDGPDGHAAAKRFAENVFRHTGVKLTISQSYSVGVKTI